MCNYIVNVLLCVWRGGGGCDFNHCSSLEWVVTLEYTFFFLNEEAQVHGGGGFLK